MQSPSRSLSHRRRGWLILELLVGFVPLVAILAVGVLMIPVWVGMLAAPIFNADYREAIGPLEILITVGSLLLVVVGFLGLIGLKRVVRSILAPETSLEHPQRTRVYAMGSMLVIAVLSALYLSFGYPIVAALGAIALVVSGHVIYLARHKLFEKTSA